MERLVCWCLAALLVAGCVGVPAHDDVDAGIACAVDSDCASGVCEGEGCDPGDGVCAPAIQLCTRDLVSYCGCDGVTFRSPSNCPGRRFTSIGTCGD